MRNRNSASYSLPSLNSKSFSARQPYSGSLTPVKLPKLTPQTSKNQVESVNYFATKVDIEGGDDAHLEHPSPESMVRLTYYQGHRSGRWEAFSNGLFKPNYKEENSYRVPKIKELLQQFLACKERMISITGKEIKDLESRIIQIAESIFSLYNINLNVMSNPVIDSHLELLPVKNKAEFVRGLLALVPEICKFPYSFYAKIDLISISLCGLMIISKPNSKKLIEKRLYNGLFPLGVLGTEDQVVRHFYRILTYLIKMIDINFDKKLTRAATITRSRTMLMNSTNFIVSEHIKSKKDNSNSLDYQSRLLRSLVTKPHSILFHASDTVCFKGGRYKNILEVIDPDGMNIEFWNQLGAGDINESLEFIEQIE